MSKKTETIEVGALDIIESNLLAHSVHYLSGEISNDTIGPCIKWILHENMLPRTPGKFLTLYINSFGGDLYEAFGLIDIMRTSHLPIRTVGVGSVMSAAFLIFAAGTKGQRVLGRNTGVMCHQYSDSPEGKHHDLKAHMLEGERCNQRMMEILKAATNLPASKIRSKMLKETDVYMTAEEAVELGIADSII